MNRLTQNRQFGFSLIEVMVALVILSVGLLGLAGMQVTGLRSVSNSSNYSLAALAVNDLAERMRLNPAALDAGILPVAANPGGAVNNGSYLVDFTNYDCTVVPTSCTGNATCTHNQLADYDIYTWYCGDSTGNGVSNALDVTSPATIIQCIDTPTTDADTCSPGSPYEINLQWSEVNQDVDGAGDTTTQSVYMRILQ